MYIVKTQQIVQVIKYIQFPECQLCLNKAKKKMFMKELLTECEQSQG